MLKQVLARLPVSVIHVVPAYLPPLRTGPRADPRHRVNMVRLGIEGHDRLLCDTREIDRRGTSYTVLTLESLRFEYPSRRLALILGRDAFERLPQWHRWREILELADIVVINRPGNEAPACPPEWLESPPAPRLDPEARIGQVVFLDIVPCAISATELRRRLSAGGDVTGMLAPSVLQYIEANHLYG